MMLHPVAWVGWLVAAIAALSVTRNPLHLILVILCIAIVYVTVSSTEDAPYQLTSPFRFAGVVVLLSVLFNAATVHLGDTVLLHLPEGLPIIGGPITMEAVVFGLTNGLVLTGIFLAFATLGQALPVRALIRLVPRPFFPVAVVVSVGVTFVPVTVRQFHQIREAQSVRGHRVQGVRDWMPLLMPLLIGGLERALQMAEAMTSRGFASVEQEGQDVAPRLAMVVGLAALLGGWLMRLIWGQDLMGSMLMFLGIGFILGVLWLAGRRYPRTVYRPAPWTGRDWVVIAGAGLVLGAFTLLGIDRTALSYYPYPALSLPRFDPFLGMVTLCLLVPAFVQRLERNGKT
jgi:energy-coupling factor transport system permease protein